MQYVGSSGLLDGKMGIILFFYEYARNSNRMSFSEFADDNLDDILETINKKNNTDSISPNDLYSIGWCIQYLINNKFIEGDSDDILFDFDKKTQTQIDKLEKYISADWLKFMAVNPSLLWLDTYIIARSCSKIFNEDNINKIIHFYRRMLTTATLTPMFILNSYYAFLAKIDSTFLNLECKNSLLKELGMAYKNTLENNYYDTGDLHFFTRISSFFDTPLIIADFKNGFKKISDKKIILKPFISEMLYFNQEFPKMDPEYINECINYTVNDIQSNNLILASGLSGIGLSIIKSKVQI